MGLRGAPDDYHLRLGAVTYPVADLAELAARLGSIVTYDRRGDVVFMDDFEHGLARWRTGLVGVGSTAGLSVAYARSGACSAQLHAAAVSSGSARIFSYAGYRTLSKFGLEVAFTVDEDVGWIEWLFGVLTGSRYVQGEVQYYPGTNLLRVRTGITSWYNVDGALDLFSTDWLFHVFKLVVDLDEEDYVRLLVDAHEYDLSAYSPYAYALGTAPYLWMQLGAYGDGSNAADIYIDDVIITQDEP